jgi:hypothetical protein
MAGDNNAVSSTNWTDFSLVDLYAALEAERSARGITWREAMREINVVGRWHVHPLSHSTVRSLRTKAVAEGDGILQLLRWLKRTPESFMRGCDRATADAMRLPDLPPHQILRFDTKRLFAALNTARLERGRTWVQVAQEIGMVSPASLTHLQKGGRTAFPGVMRMVRWLDRPAADFVRASSI